MYQFNQIEIQNNIEIGEDIHSKVEIDRWIDQFKGGRMNREIDLNGWMK